MCRERGLKEKIYDAPIRVVTTLSAIGIEPF